MTDDRTCITFDLERVHRADRPHRCTRRGVHFAACEDPTTCRGCVPRTATNGLLCPVCWEKVNDALNRVGDLIVHLRSIDSEGQALGERVATSRRIKLPVYESWLAADGLLDALGASPIPSTAPIEDVFKIAENAVTAWHNLDEIVNTRAGAKRAVVLVKRMQGALRRWPDSEAHYRRVPFLLCPSCSRQTLWRRAPLEFLDELVVECAGSPLMYSIGDGYDYCEWRMDWSEFVGLYGPIFEGILRDQERRERAEARERRAARLAEAFKEDA